MSSQSFRTGLKCYHPAVTDTPLFNTRGWGSSYLSQGGDTIFKGQPFSWLWLKVWTHTRSWTSPHPKLPLIKAYKYTYILVVLGDCVYYAQWKGGSQIFKGVTYFSQVPHNLQNHQPLDLTNEWSSMKVLQCIFVKCCVSYIKTKYCFQESQIVRFNILKVSSSLRVLL